MNDEKRQILEMVGEGKISQEDALRLLEALEDDRVDRAFGEAMAHLREEPPGSAPPPPAGPGSPPRQEDIWGGVEEAAREVGQVLSQTAAAAMDAVTEGVQWAKGAVQKIPGVSPWWEGAPGPEEEPMPYSCGDGPAPVEKLDIEWVNGPVEIIPWEGAYVNVTEYSQRPLDEGQRLELIVTDGGTMRIRWTLDKGFWKGLRLSKYLLVQVPAGQSLEKVKVSNVSGGIKAEKLTGEKWDLSTTTGPIEATGLRGESCKLTSISGALRIEDVQAEELRLSTTSGRIEAPGFGAEHAKLSTVSGAVEAYGNGESLELKSVSGSLTLQTAQPPESVRLETISGRVTLTLPPNNGFTAKYESMSGAFSTGFPVSGKMEGKSGKAVYGDGSMKISLNTMSGKMEIRPTEP